MRKQIIHVVTTFSRSFAIDSILSLVKANRDHAFEYHLATLDSPRLAHDRRQVLTRIDSSDQTAWVVPEHEFVRQLRDELRDQKVNLFCANRCRRSDLRALLRFRKFVHERKPCVIHSWDDTATRWASYVRPNRRSPLVISNSNANPNGTKRFFRRTVANVMIANGIAEQSYLRQQFGHTSTMVAPPNPPKVTSAKFSRDLLCKSLKLPTDASLIGVANDSKDTKTWKDVIWATELLKHVDSSVHLLIAECGKSEWRLRRYCDLIRVCDNVRFVPDELHQRDWLHLLNCVILPGDSFQDTAKIVQAMTSFVPVIASDTECHRELITSSENGFLVRRGDRADYARQIWRILRDEELARQMTTNAIARIRDDYSPAQMIEKHTRLYRELAA